jgi:hypothetical protein
MFDRYHEHREWLEFMLAQPAYVSAQINSKKTMSIDDFMPTRIAERVSADPDGSLSLLAGFKALAAARNNNGDIS